MNLLKKMFLINVINIFYNIFFSQNKDPVKYIFEVCVNCKDYMLRNYLSEHLISIACFENEYINSWNIIKSISQFEQKHM